MMQDTKIITAIDVGTSKVCTLMARRSGANGVKVLAHSVVPSEGLEKGNVADVASAEKAIRRSIRQCEIRAGVKIPSAHVGIAGSHVSFENRWDELGWAGKEGVITAEELDRVPTSVAAAGAESGRQVIHAIPMVYALDGQRGIRDPKGMHSRQLEVQTHVVTGASSFVDKLLDAVQSTGVKVDSLVLEPLASSEAVLTRHERLQRVAVVDIGGGTTDVVVFKGGRMFFTAVIPVGGYQFTNDICQTYDTTYATAEEVKIEHAHADPFLIHPQEEISLAVSGMSREIKVPRRDICQLTRERAQELMRLIKLKLQDANMGEFSNVQLVLTGGTANLPGLAQLATQTITNRVRIGVPDGRTNVPQELKAPSHSTGVGILLWAMNQSKPVAEYTTNGKGADVQTGTVGIFSRLLERARNLWLARLS